MAMVFEDLSQRTFRATSPDEIDNMCNGFKEKFTVRFTQAHQIYCPTDGKIYYINTLFFVPEKQPVSEPTISGTLKNKIVKDDAVDKDDDAVDKTETPNKFSNVPESEAQWTNCLLCNMRWKWTHFKWCPQRHGLESLPEELHAKYKEIWNGNGNEGDNKDD